MNENNQKGMFVLYEWIETTSELTDEQFGQLIRGLFLYNTENKTTQFNDPTTKMAFCFLKQAVDRLNDNYLKKKNAGSHGGAPKGNKNASKKNKGNKQKQAETTENNLPIPIPIPIPIPNPNPIPLSGEGDAPAPAREGFEDFELFGILHNVKLKPAHVRHLHETYGTEIADETIDDLSCKLADGSVNSADHYATLLTWLRYRRRTDTGPVPMSSAQVQPETIQENDYSYAEECFLKAWQEYEKTPHTESDKYWYLNQLAKDGGATPKTLTLIGLKLIDNQWLFDNEQTDK